MTELLWFILAMGASMMWGLVYVLDKKVLETFSVVEVLVVYHMLSALACIGFMTVTGRGATLMARMSVPENAKWMLITAVCAFIANVLILRSVQLSNATVAAIVEISYPLFTVLFSYLILRANTLTIDVAIGGALILAGATWIAVKA